MIDLICDCDDAGHGCRRGGDDDQVSVICVRLKGQCLRMQLASNISGSGELQALFQMTGYWSLWSESMS